MVGPKPGDQICPLAAVDRRLEDAHQLWHQAEQDYFDPDRFRLAFQSTIQTLRSVTFILQSNKSLIPNFDHWYESWRIRMRNDRLMRWLVEARNKIEKQGDLESESYVRAEIVASYLDEGPGLEVPARLFEGLDELLESIPEEVREKHVMKHGALRVQRRWVEDSLPDYELLDALAIAYGRLAEIVHDAHRQMGLPPPEIQQEHGGAMFDRESLGWRMPCMIGHHDPRTLLISLSDGSQLTLGEHAISIDDANVEVAIDRYGPDLLEQIVKGDATLDGLAENYFNVARRMFESDGYHQSIIFLVRDGSVIKLIQTSPEDQLEKYLLMRRLSQEVTRFGADAVFIIHEAWMAEASDLEPFQRASEAANKKEALVLIAGSKAGNPFEFIAMIARDGKTVSLGPTERTEGGAAFMFAPIYEVWGKEIPGDWLDMIKRYEAAVRKNGAEA